MLITNNDYIHAAYDQFEMEFELSLKRKLTPDEKAFLHWMATKYITEKEKVTI